MSIISNIRGAECVICALFYDCRGAYGIKPAGSDYSRLPSVTELEPKVNMKNGKFTAAALPR